MLLGIIGAFTLGASIALFGWMLQRAEPVAFAASERPAAAVTTSRSRPPLPAQSSQPSDHHIGSMILSYSLLRSAPSR